MAYPEQGDIIFIDAEPHAGHETGGHDPRHGNIQRPLIVLSNTGYNQFTGMVSGMPITHEMRDDNTRFMQFIDGTSGVHGSIILWQMPFYDFDGRHGRIVGHVSPRLLNTLLARVKDIFDL
ncbi:type II toxin-antitoxin system PemK/MazF family toxin [Furfurilactobacillus rossiae]|uniref:Uncharacterized protein n=1 Tax=Furfurilactobacillus rossiae DSM 15814 TaxID=1114972 RepID=A0A0R1RBH3_9LACO|nr:type II toxin-antitoxin system PemK/MazF family toxin [Furfurilactobacillus rossiae]KRL54367.1 hypothetical protein FD35_GL002709 [Furfurilactobacillus rossiae DSM 15814]QFR66907.1 type II toxin-antitoxin system PemK/MazF family toxin [Furfurilactobacillus rossiae]QLE62403.1 transcriptional modulator of MazE-toxin MazF [Furfurilactobacillus rossiae]